MKKQLTDNKHMLDNINKELVVYKKRMNTMIKSLFSNEWTFSKRFIDDNGKHKLFIIPMNKNGGYDRMNFSASVNYCSELNSTSVEMQSQRKQLIFESFMRELGYKSDEFNHFWINGGRDSSGEFVKDHRISLEKFKWFNSGNQFSYTNWDSKQPYSMKGFDYVVVSVSKGNSFGKWFTNPIAVKWHVICELELNVFDT